MTDMADKELSPEDIKINTQIMISVRAWFEEKGVKQKDIVNYGIIKSESMVSKWLNGTISPKVSQLNQIAEMLEIDLPTLLTHPSKCHNKGRVEAIKEIAQQLDDSAYQSWINIGKQLTK